MRQTTVFLNDFLTKRRTGVTFTENDFLHVDQKWNEEDQQLLALQSVEVFTGLLRYSELQTEHLRVLLQSALTHYAKLSDGERAEPTHPTTALVSFLLLALIKRLETSTGSIVELLRVNRVSEYDIAFDFSATMDMNFAKPPPAKNADFKVIVGKG